MNETVLPLVYGQVGFANLVLSQFLFLNFDVLFKHALVSGQRNRPQSLSVNLLQEGAQLVHFVWNCYCFCEIGHLCVLMILLFALPSYSFNLKMTKYNLGLLFVTLLPCIYVTLVSCSYMMLIAPPVPDLLEGWRCPL